MKELRPWDALDFVTIMSIAAVIGVTCAWREVRADEPDRLPAGTCDALTNAGYVDKEGRLEFVIPFQAEPECDCAPGPCNVVASPSDAVYKRPFGTPPSKSPTPPRIVCWGRR